MEQHSLADCLIQLKGKLQQEGNSIQTLLIFDQIDSKFYQHLDSHQSLQKLLTEKQTQLKQTTRRLKKTNNKLNRKSEECLALQEELKHVNVMHNYKVEQLKTQAASLKFKEDGELPAANRYSKKHKPKQQGSQCQVLKLATFEELSAQNQILKVRLEEAQKTLIKEKFERETKTQQLQELREIYENANSQIIKDNSTDDTGSHKGDPFYFEQEVQVGIEEEQMAKSFLKKDNVLSQIWEYSKKMCRTFIFRD